MYRCGVTSGDNMNLTGNYLKSIENRITKVPVGDSGRLCSLLKLVFRNTLPCS